MTTPPASSNEGAVEYNFDGLVGPSHNYAGLSTGNVASTNNAALVANPRKAALQGLAKMHALSVRGFAQAVLPPQRRPDFGWLRRIGFIGTNADVIARASREAPSLLSAAYSASAMWTANAATVSPSTDTADGRVHVTVANLNAKAHRALEHLQTLHMLRKVFPNPKFFAVHPALPSTPAFGDEGAANHGRICARHGDAGVEIFVFGRSDFDVTVVKPKRYEGRQTLEAGQAISRLHGLQPGRTVHIQQNPTAIDSGVFHNDVIAVTNGPVLFYQEHAFLDSAAALSTIQRAAGVLEIALQPICVETAVVPMADAVSSYLFNSQLLSRPDQKMTLVVPQECLENSSVDRFLQDLVISSTPIDEVIAFELQESMRNGGGPACLRLRVVLTEHEARAMHRGVVMTDLLYQQLETWIKRHYRDRLAPEDLADPLLSIEINMALTSLAEILGLPDLYASTYADAHDQDGWE